MGQSIDSVVGLAKTNLGNVAPIVLPENRPIARVVVSKFQSRVFQAAYCMGGRFNEPDSSLTEIDFKDKSRSFIISGKVSTGCPREIVPDGADCRPVRTLGIHFDGRKSLKIFDVEAGTVENHRGKSGRPDYHLPALRQTLGRQIGQSLTLENEGN